MDEFIPESPSQTGKVYGCLLVLDDGSDYIKHVEEIISRIEKEKEDFIKAVEDNKLKRHDAYSLAVDNYDLKNEDDIWDSRNWKTIPQYEYEPVNKEMEGYSFYERKTFDDVIAYYKEELLKKKYKCQCNRCGKIRFYSLGTLQANPQYCLRPEYCSSKYIHSTKASRANDRQREKYDDNEAVRLVDDREKTNPSDEYCEAWNKKRTNDIRKRQEKENAIIAALPRKPGKNYENDYIGLNYESIEILKCVNDVLEEPHYYTRHRRKQYYEVVVYKEYIGKCYLCGKEHKIRCDKFGIYPPTEYGNRALDGFWSEVYCDCHKISSFQWIVNKLLIENGVKYKVEYSFPDLLGCYGKKLLQYDFAIIDDTGHVVCLIECQGEQHYKPVKEFGGDDKFTMQQKNDELKRMYAEEHKIPLIEISYKDKKIEKIRSILVQNKVFYM